VFELIESLESALCVGLTSTGVSKMLGDLSFQYGRLKQLESELLELEKLFPIEVIATESATGKTAALTYSVGFFSLRNKLKFALKFEFSSPASYPFGQLDWSLSMSYGDIESVFFLFLLDFRL